MPNTNVGSRWNAGKLEFYDVSTGTTVLSIDGPNTALTIPDGTVTFAKSKMFVSTEKTGTGSSQNIAHGLGVAPSAVLIVPTDTSPTTAGDYTATEGTHTTTNVVATVTSGKKFKVWAMA